MNELNVITVPAMDWDGSIHTAFTVYSEADGVLLPLCSPLVAQGNNVGQSGTDHCPDVKKIKDAG